MRGKDGETWQTKVKIIKKIFSKPEKGQVGIAARLETRFGVGAGDCLGYIQLPCVASNYHVLHLLHVIIVSCVACYVLCIERFMIK